MSTLHYTSTSFVSPSSPNRDSSIQINIFRLSFSPIQNQQRDTQSVNSSRPNEANENATIDSDINSLEDIALQHLASVALSVMQSRGLPPPNAPTVTPPQTTESVPLSTRLSMVSPLRAHPIQTLNGSAKSMLDICSNTHFEQIACAGLSVKFDGSSENLIPTSDLIHICCINEVWNSATYITTT